MRPVTERTAYALSMVGRRELAGRCEQFTRQAFGFPARYGSALLAWHDTNDRHADIYTAPEGVPLFANLHPANPNHRFGHVWYSLGGGYSVTTSAGPGRSIAKVRTRDLVTAWGMSPLGWTTDYHRNTIWPSPDLEDIMATLDDDDLRAIAQHVWAHGPQGRTAWDVIDRTNQAAGRMDQALAGGLVTAITRAVGHAVWAYRNERLEGVDTYQILRDARDAAQAPTREEGTL